MAVFSCSTWVEAHRVSRHLSGSGNQRLHEFHPDGMGFLSALDRSKGPVAAHMCSGALLICPESSVHCSFALAAVRPVTLG